MHIRYWAIVIVICVSVTAVLAGFKVNQIRAAIAYAESFPEQSEAVRAVTVMEKKWTPMVTALGEVLALNSVDLRNELGGKIVEVGFKPGASVKKDQLLLRLDISEESAQLKAAEAETELARLDLDRYRRLMKSNASSKDQYDRAMAEMSVAVARAQALQAVIDKKTIRAPFDAESGLHELELGQYLPDNTLITRLVGVSRDVWIDFYLPQQQSRVKIGTPLSATFEGLLAEPAHGEVIARDSVVVSESRNRRIRALFYNVSDVLRPGALVELKVPVGEERTVSVLPATAIRRDNFGAYVYVLKTDKESKVRASKRKITLGPEQEQSVIVISGLERGERIASIGSHKLKDGMLVILNPATSATHREGDNTDE